MLNLSLSASFVAGLVDRALVVDERDAVVDEGKIDVEVVEESVVDEEDEVDDVDADGKDRLMLPLAKLQNCCASNSAVVTSEGHWEDMHVTISFVNCLLEQKQLTATTLVQLADELPSARQFETQDETPLKLGNCAELVGVGVAVELKLVLNLLEVELCPDIVEVVCDHTQTES